MKEVFEKIKKRIEEKREYYYLNDDVFDTIAVEALDFACDVLDEEVKALNAGWIPVEDRYPDTDNYILLSFSNFSIPIIGRYEEDENGGAFYAGDEDVTLVSQDMFVNAWMPLVKPYKLEEPLKDCNTCANYTEPDEIDNGCYMCCKGYENNYQPKGE